MQSHAQSKPRPLSNLSVHDLNALLSILNKLSEQQWCKSVLGTPSKQLTKQFACVSRPHSALDRLSTFVAQDVSLHYLADYGFVYRGDDAIQSVYGSHEQITEISDNCIDVISSSLVLKQNVN